MLTFFNEKTSSIMGNGLPSGETKSNDENEDEKILHQTLRQKTADGLIFFAGTDKAHVITEILEARGWSRTKDHNVTNYTIKWCLAHQVDWNQFQEGKQLINNIPGQLTFSDKINLWYTIRDYLRNRRTLDGNHIQNFLPMTFVLDEENEVTEFLRFYRKQNRTWICKPRYSYAGRGIYVLSGSSDLNTIFKFKVGINNRLQYEPRLPGYLMQEYIARPLLIKGRKFDIRVHWLVAWTKPLLVFYNHNASVVRLSLNLYREFDYDRATHLTNLSVQENHCRYAYAYESTGMTMTQLNHYFNQCFRPFHPRMCQDWVMTIMQERMQTIIRHVIRASKDKLTRGAGQFGFFGCDFLLDENFRIWLLEINDNPGVGWGNARVNTTTKPLFEETLNIVLECFDKYKKNESLLPIQCLKDYQLIYNEDDDAGRLIRDDNQVFTERLSIRYVIKQRSSRLSFRRILPRVSTSQTTTHQSDNNNNININNNVVLPLINMTSPESPVIDLITPTTPIRDTTPLDFSITDTMPLKLSVTNTPSLILPIANIVPLTPPIIDTSPLPPSIIERNRLTPPIIDPSPLPPRIICKTPTNLSQIDIKPSISSIIDKTPLTVSTVITTLLNTNPSDTNDNIVETIESLKHDDDIELERLMQPKSATTKSLITSPILTTRTNSKNTKSSIKRTLSNTNPIAIQRKKRIDLTPVIIDNRRYIHRHPIVPTCTETMKNKSKLSKNKPIIPNEKPDKTETQTDLTDLLSSSNINFSEVYSPN